MIRFIDIRGQETGFRFAFWNTINNSFVCVNAESAWENWDDFEQVAKGIVDIERYYSLCPEW